MRASDLIGREVVDAGGSHVGYVSDLRCVQDGPVRGTLAAPRVHALLVDRHHVGSRLGYQDRDQHGPWIIAALIRLLHRHSQVIEWDQVQMIENRFRIRG
jgi:sporulation protein YlmC with PRC-barrel domain